MAGNRLNKPGSGPGRGTPRARATARPAPGTARSAPSPASPPAKQPGRGLGLTRRAVILIAIVALLAITYANSLRIYFGQQMEIATIRAGNEARQHAIDKLNDEITRWKDPEYVRAQARSRLGWVVPGEVGYRVIGSDGKPIGQGVELESGATPEQLDAWWEKLWNSAKAADDPVVKASGAPTVGASPKPAASPSR